MVGRHPGVPGSQNGGGRLAGQAVVTGKGFSGSVAKGQHWLIDQTALSQLAAFCRFLPDQLLVEIGPGRGHLTDHLLALKPSKLIALEIDRQLVGFLKDRYRVQIEAGRLEIIETDCRTFDWTGLGQSYAIAGNIPYYLTAYLLRRLVDTPARPDRASLLLPAPVAQKLVQSNRRSLLATIVQFNYSLELGPALDRSCFQPVPRIDSRALALTEPKQIDNWDSVLALVKAGFSQPRRYLVNNLTGYHNLTAPELKRICRSLAWPESVRAEVLSNRDWLSLRTAIDSGRL